MNFDVNAIASLMQAMQKPPANDVKRDIPQSAPKTERVSDVSPFCAQNGLGEQIRINTDESGGEQKNAFADIMGNLAKQNPMFSLVSAMQGGKGDMASLLPLVLSLMQSQKPKNEEKNGTNVENDAHSSEKRAESNSEQTENVSKECGNKDSENIKKEKEKTQRDVFAPVAFAGYEVVSKLCALMKLSR